MLECDSERGLEWIRSAKHSRQVEQRGESSCLPPQITGADTENGRTSGAARGIFWGLENNFYLIRSGVSQEMRVYNPRVVRAPAQSQELIFYSQPNNIYKVHSRGGGGSAI